MRCDAEVVDTHGNTRHPAANRRTAEPPNRRTAVGGCRGVDALIALAVFAALGAALLDDYGVAWDEAVQRSIGQAAIAYAQGDAGALPPGSDRYYGAAFEAPLILVERLLGLTDSRAVYLSRHLLTHLFFLTGGFFCWLLAFRLFRDRRLALFALLLFLLQPRLYAHSFFNTKDIPFLVMFMIALYLTQRAFRRDTAGAFALCGLGVGVLVNLRIMGLLLCAAVPALRALDLLQAHGPAERRRALATGGAFLLAAAAALYAVSPHLWRDPLELIDAVATFARHPTRIPTLFQGELVRCAGDSAALPADLDGDHHAAGGAAAEPGRDRCRTRTRSDAPARGPPQHARHALRGAAGRLSGAAGRGRHRGQTPTSTTAGGRCIFWPPPCACWRSTACAGCWPPRAGRGCGAASTRWPRRAWPRPRSRWR